MTQAVNNSEQFVFELCRNTCLSLWSYVNPQGKDSGKELCDILIVCDPHVLVFSVKEVILKDTGNPDVDWTRWERKAIDASIKQINGAVGWLKQSDYVVRKDGSTGVNLPPPNRRIYHRIAVAFGAKRQIPVNFSRKEGVNFFHILDERSSFLILRCMDTVSDFVQYLTDKETALATKSVIINGGEEDLLALYLHNGRKFPAGDLLVLNDDLWNHLSRKPEFLQKIDEDQDSYIWDKLIEILSNDDSGGTLGSSATPSEAEHALRILAHENRFSRRVLGGALREFLELATQQKVRSRCLRSMNNIVFVFLASSADERESRRDELTCRCFAALARFPEILTIVGIGIDRPRSEPNKYSSTDLVLLQSPTKWDQDAIAKAIKIRDELGYFKSPNETHRHIEEYPIVDTN